MTQQDLAPLSVEESEDGVTLTLGDGDGGNWLPIPVIETMRELYLDAAARRKKWVLLRHEGRDFCLGRKPGKLSETDRQALINLAQTVESAEVITIAAAEGACEGFAVGLFALSDLSVAGERATFRFPEILAGFAPSIVASWLPDRAPYKQALAWMLTGEAVSAREGLDFGLATRVVPEGSTPEVVEAWTAQFAGQEREPLVKCKTATRVLRRVRDDDWAKRTVALKWLS